MPFADINGRSLYYEVHGQGDTIVLLHHGFGCTKMWKGIYPGLVENGYRVVMYDRRGYGRSERGADFEDFYFSDRFCSDSVDDMAVLMKALNIDSFHTIGQCEGGVIAIEYAVRYPDQVKTAIIASTQCYSKITMAEFNKIKFPEPFRDLEQGLREKFIDWHGKDYAESSYNLFGKYGGAYGIGFFDLRNLLPSVGCPTLVLYPDRSFLFDVEQAVAFYHHLPRGELAILPKCGHNTYEYQPQEYIRLALNFLKRHEGREQNTGHTSTDSPLTCLA